MHKLVLLRHGESTWNRENRFTGWTDVDLTDEGRAQARSAAAELGAGGFTFDVAHTSLLKRAIRTLWIVLDEMNLMWVPVLGSWRLNERHYGALQGLDKAETAREYGEEQVRVWRRSYDTPPPEIAPDDPRSPSRDPRYAGVPDIQTLAGETLADTVKRFLPYWLDIIAPDIRSGRRVIVVAHGNSLRALVKYLDGMSDEDIVGLDIPTGVPLVYDLDDDLRPAGREFLGDPDAVDEAMQTVANQGKARS